MDLRSLQLPQIKPHIQSDSFENDPRQPITEAIGLSPPGGQRKQMLIFGHQALLFLNPSTPITFVLLLNQT